jgi:exodeoxyribonuclease VII large subunit
MLVAQLAARQAALERSGAGLVALGPQATLDRGYAIVRRRADDAIVRGTADAPTGERLAVRLSRGEIAATVDATPATGPRRSGRVAAAGGRSGKPGAG